MAARKPVVEAPPLPTREQWAEYVKTQTAANPQFVPPAQVVQEDITEWQAAVEASNKARSRELAIRFKLFGFFFPNPTEGSNNVKLADGSKLNLSHKIDRKVDEERLATFQKYTVADLRSLFTQLNITNDAWPDDMPAYVALQLNMGKLIKWAPGLEVKEYRTLTAEQSAVFEQVLDIKPAGTPTLKYTDAAGTDSGDE